MSTTVASLVRKARRGGDDSVALMAAHAPAGRTATQAPEASAPEAAPVAEPVPAEEAPAEQAAEPVAEAEAVAEAPEKAEE
jgi:hypothetical protein